MKLQFTYVAVFLAFGMLSQTMINGPFTKIHDLRQEHIISGFDEEYIFTTDLLTKSDIFTTSYYLYTECRDKITLELIYRKEIEMQTSSKFRMVKSLQHLMFQNGYLNYFVCIYNYKKNRKDLLVYQVDLRTGQELEPDTILTIDIEDMPVVSNAGKGYARWGEFEFHSSKDNKRFLIHSTKANFDLGQTEETLFLYDSNLKLIKKKKFIRESVGKIPDDIILDNEGSIYYKKGKEFVFLDFYQDYDEWKEVIPNDVMESNAKVKRLTGSFDPKGNLIIIGHYVTEDLQDTEENKEKRETYEGDTQVEGVFYMEVDGFNKEIKHVVVSKFDAKFIAEFKDKMHVDKGLEAEMNDVFTEFSIKFTDSMTLVLGQKTRQIDDDIERGDIVVYGFNNKGKLQWGHRIGKIQLGAVSKSKSTGYSSFLDEENLYVLFNDDERNYENGKRVGLEFKAYKNEKKAVPVLFTFDMKTGEFNYELKKDWVLNKETNLLPSFSKQEGPRGPVYLFQESKKKVALSKIILNK